MYLLLLIGKDTTVLPKEEWKDEHHKITRVSDIINKLKNAISNMSYLNF